MKTPSLKSAVEDVLLQGCALLNTVSSGDYIRKEDGANGSSLGAHYRHVLDHFFCLVDGIATGEIDYDQRRRDPELENSVGAAMLATGNLIKRFRSLPVEMLQRECMVVYSVGYEEREPQAARSTLTREVMFCVGHAIHHFAILKLLCSGMSVKLPYEFGVAPSTLKHLEEQMVH